MGAAGQPVVHAPARRLPRDPCPADRRAAGRRGARSRAASCDHRGRRTRGSTTSRARAGCGTPARESAATCRCSWRSRPRRGRGGKGRSRADGRAGRRPGAAEVAARRGSIARRPPPSRPPCNAPRDGAARCAPNAASRRWARDWRGARRRTPGCATGCRAAPVARSRARKARGPGDARCAAARVGSRGDPAPQPIRARSARNSDSSDSMRSRKLITTLTPCGSRSSSRRRRDALRAAKIQRVSNTQGVASRIARNQRAVAHELRELGFAEARGRHELREGDLLVAIQAVVRAVVAGCVHGEGSCASFARGSK